MDFSAINAMINGGKSFDDIMNVFNKEVDSHPLVLEDNERRRKIINRHTLPKLREMIKVLGIKKMSGKKKSELVEALVDADWDGESDE